MLLVFSSNTVISFACSYSSFFHSFHHHKTSANATHKHADTKHKHDHSSSHHAELPNDDEQKENCCSNIVVQLQKVEKAISRNIDAPNAASSPLFLSGYLLAFIDLFHPDLQRNISTHEIRWRPPATIQDLRIVIQSFQI